MADGQNDRRVQRSKQFMYSALMNLVAEKPFEKITVQDILDRANVGRTTFYAHFQSKEDLFLSSHEQIINAISRSFFTEDGSLRVEPSTELIAFLQLSQGSRDMYYYLTGGSDRGDVLRLLKERIATQLEAQLHTLFREEESTIPFTVLAQHIASSLVSLSSWWMEKRTPYTVLELANMLHEMNYIVLRKALGK